MKPTFTTSIFLLLISSARMGFAGPAGNDDRDHHAEEVHREAIVVDGHNDVATWIVDFGFDLGMNGWEEGDSWAWSHLMLPWLPWSGPSADQLRTHTDLQRMEQGGVDAQFFSVWPSAEYYDPDAPVPGKAIARTHAIIDALNAQIRRHEAKMELALTAQDVRRIVSEGKLAALFGVEGGHAIEDDLENLRDFYRRGARYMTLTWSFSHNWADASGDPFQAAKARHGGLTEFGRTVVREMNDLGMLVDVSHVSDDTFWDAIETSRAPIIASHSCVRAIDPHPRNVSDEMLQAIAANGGVVMINFSVIYLDPRKSTNTKLAWDWVTHFGGSETTVSHVADHIDHVVRIAGIDHVGLGSDYDATPFVPSDLAHVGQLPNLTTELVRRGYSDEDIRKVLGENLLRVLSRAEQLSSPSRGRQTNPSALE